MNYQTALDEVIALLNAESLRLFGEPLDDEQTEAVFDEDQCFLMLDDMETRMGFRVRNAMILATNFYNADPCDVLEAPAVPHRVADSLIGSLANATLEPMTDTPHRVAGQHVTLDARGVDHWSRNNGR